LHPFDGERQLAMTSSMNLTAVLWSQRGIGAEHAEVDAVIDRGAVGAPRVRPIPGWLAVR